VTPPRIVSLPQLDLPPNVAVPESGIVEVVVLVGVDGRATLEECGAEPALCAQVAQAVGGARFEPAQRAGTPLAARVRLALRVASPSLSAPAADGGIPEASPEADADAGLVPPAIPADAALPTSTPDEAQPRVNHSGGPGTHSASSAAPDLRTYGARGRVEQIQQPGMRRLELAEMRDMPGTLGDPFRAVEALPGIVPVLSGLPYFYVRGSPPAGTLYFYDGMPMPLLYHFAGGPAVIHPRMVGPIRLYSGVAPARYGRLTGAAVVGEGPDSADGKTHLEAELRLLDVSAYAQTELLGGSLTVAGRYGYPALLLSVFSPSLSLSYWDYQLRFVRPVSARDRLELVALGSYDSFGQTDSPQSSVAITFHRLEPRWVHHRERDELGVAVALGWEASSLGDEVSVRTQRLAPRAWYEHRFSSRSRLRVSADLQQLYGGVRSQQADSDALQALQLPSLSHGSRSVLGAQLELVLRPWDALEFQLGARGDAWLTRDANSSAFDPRARVILHANERFDLHVAAGMVHQPAVAAVPLPGLSELGDVRNLQSAVQAEAGVGWDTPLELRAELQLFVHRYANLMFTDTTFPSDSLEEACMAFDCMGASIPRQINGWSYGFELFMRRPITHALSGFASYTLAWSAVDPVAGLPYTPSWDVRHVVNLALQWQLGAGFSAGLRGFLRSGKVDGEYYIRNQWLARDERRLPSFFRVDLELAYAWRTAWSRMRFSLEWFNVSLAREPQGINCDEQHVSCSVRYLPALFFPNLSLRAEH